LREFIIVSERFCELKELFTGSWGGPPWRGAIYCRVEEVRHGVMLWLLGGKWMGIER